MTGARGAELEASLEQALSAAQAAQAMVLQLTGERQALQSQLAAASSEVEVTRRMAAALEQEHHAAAERLRLRSEREVNSLVEKMQVRHSCTIAGSVCNLPCEACLRLDTCMPTG